MKKIFTQIFAVALLLSCWRLEAWAADSESLKFDIFTYTISGTNATITNVEDVRAVVEIPEIIGNHKVVAIDDGAFGGSKEVEKVIIPEGVSTLGSMCFAYSSGIRFVELPSTLTQIGEGAFYHCTALDSVSLPDALTTIPSKAFGLCENLSAITIHGNVSTIDEDAFYSSERVKIYCPYSSPAYTYAQNHGLSWEELITVTVNDHKVIFDQPPVTDTKYYRTLVPLRAVLELMGAQVDWDSTMNTAGLTIDDYRLLVKPGATFMMVNGKARSLSCPAIEYNDRVLLPIRDIVESVGGQVDWDEEGKTVSIRYKNAVAGSNVSISGD